MMEKTGIPKPATTQLPTKEASAKEFPGDNSIADRVATETERVCQAYNRVKKETK